MSTFSLEGIEPEFDADGSNYLAPGAIIIGKVRIGRDVNVWSGAIIRGDNELILIEEGSNIQEHVMLHTDPGFPLKVGKFCTIGHRALLHGCTVSDNSLIGMGAIILNGAKIGRNCLVGAGALVTEGKEFPDNSLIVGAPARIVRTLDDVSAARLRASALHYIANGKRFMSGLQPLG